MTRQKTVTGLNDLFFFRGEPERVVNSRENTRFELLPNIACFESSRPQQLFGCVGEGMPPHTPVGCLVLT